KPWVSRETTSHPHPGPSTDPHQLPPPSLSLAHPGPSTDPRPPPSSVSEPPTLTRSSQCCFLCHHRHRSAVGAKSLRSPWSSSSTRAVSAALSLAPFPFVFPLSEPSLPSSEAAAVTEGTY
ncbi:hypothetical protein PIB30_113282, partial [Stylosanthes scabra]|nr:hypothetical protein [Stylosanthes scabra]